MADLLLSENILFVKCRLLVNYPNIRQQLTNILGSCNFVPSCCSVYGGTDCESYIIMYINDNSILSLTSPDGVLDILELSPTVITAMVLAVIIDNITEIYDVCTNINNRGSGHMKNIFKAIIENTDNDRIWLGIELDNPKWDSILNFYAKQGFGNPALVRNTGGRIKALPMTVMGLTWFKSNVNDYENTITRANYLRQQYYKTINTCTLRMHFGIKVCNKLREYLDKNIEYSGEFISDGYIVGPDGYNYANMTYPTVTEEQGIYPENINDFENLGLDPPIYMVNTENKPFTFHTHPEICYKDFGCYIGWPSGADMAWLISASKGLKHYVVTKEGIYSLQLSIDMQLLLEKYPDKVDLFYDLIRSRYENIESYRSELVPFNIRQGTVNDFMIFTNNYTINDLILSANMNINIPIDQDFSIFSLIFFEWKDIEENDGFLDCLAASDCNIEIKKTYGIGSRIDATVDKTNEPNSGIPLLKC